MAFGAEYQVLRCARTCTPGNVLVDLLSGSGSTWTCLGGQGYSILEDIVSHRDFPDQLLEMQNLACAEDMAEFGILNRCRGLDYLDFFVIGRIVQWYIEHKPVQLCFRQWVGSFLFDWILGSQNEERRWKQVPLPIDSDRSLLHSFQQGGLGFWRGTVDFIRQDNIGENRAPVKFEMAVFVQDLRTRDVGWHQVRSELDPLELQIQYFGNSAHK